MSSFSQCSNIRRKKLHATSWYLMLHLQLHNRQSCHGKLFSSWSVFLRCALPETVSGSHRTSRAGVLEECLVRPYDNSCCVQFLMWLAGMEKDHLQLKDMQRAEPSTLLRLEFKQRSFLSLLSTTSGHTSKTCRTRRSIFSTRVPH